MSNERRFAKMYDLYADDIFRYVLVRVHDQHTAEDITADTFTKAWKAVETFDFAQPRPWLYTIARNTLNDHWRKKHPIPDDFEEEPVSDADIAEATDKALEQERVRKAVGSLPDLMSSVVTLRFMLHYSAQKTADSLGISEANVRVVQHRALKKLKEKLL